MNRKTIVRRGDIFMADLARDPLTRQTRLARKVAPGQSSLSRIMLEMTEAPKLSLQSSRADTRRNCQPMLS